MRLKHTTEISHGGPIQAAAQSSPAASKGQGIRPAVRTVRPSPAGSSSSTEVSVVETWTELAGVVVESAGGRHTHAAVPGRRFQSHRMKEMGKIGPTVAVDRVTWQWLCGMPTPALCRAGPRLKPAVHCTRLIALSLNLTWTPMSTRWLADSARSHSNSC